jgi:hypothetical protein
VRIQRQEQGGLHTTYRCAALEYALMMVAVRTSETSVNFNVTIQRNIAEDSKLVLVMFEVLTAMKMMMFFRAVTLCRLVLFGETYCLHLQPLNPDVRFQVLTAASVKMTADWDIVPCSPVEVDRRFRGAYCLHQQNNES